MGKHNDEEAAALLQKIASNVRYSDRRKGQGLDKRLTFENLRDAGPNPHPGSANHEEARLVRRDPQGVLSSESVSSRTQHEPWAADNDKVEAARRRQVVSTCASRRFESCYLTLTNFYSFFDFEHCLGTMLHELCHIVRGPHDAQFYKLLDELNKEYDDLVASGFKGDGFDAPGRRVGEGVSHDVAPHVAREKALEAIQKRLRYNGWVGTAQSGQKLGGSSDLKSLERMLNPGQLAAMAAEKRAEKDRIWCGSDEQEAANGSTSGANGEPERATSSNSLVEEPARNSNDVPMDFTKDDDDVIPLERPQKKAGESSKTTTVRKEIEVINLDSDEDDSAGVVALGKRPHPKPRATYKPAIWSCSVCTLSNPLTADICGACDTPRPGWNPERAQHTQGWYCPSCMTHNPDDRFRMCSSCQFVRAL